MENLPKITDKTVLSQIKKSIDSTGEWPESVRMSFSLPTDYAVEFIKQFEKRRYQRITDRTLITKSDIISQLVWFFTSQSQVIDFRENIFNQIENMVREKNHPGTVGRPRKGRETSLEPAEAPDNDGEDL